jgi:hypothetical protein
MRIEIKNLMVRHETGEIKSFSTFKELADYVCGNLPQRMIIAGARYDVIIEDRK